MEHLNRHTELAQWLAALLRSGILVSEPVSAYLESTFGTADLDAVLANEADGEIDSLLELIFFPDMETQVRFEDRWGDVPFSEDDIDKTLRHLCAVPFDVPLINSPPNSLPLVIQAPDFALSAFVRRLNITARPDNRLMEALDGHRSRKMRLCLRVHLRNAPLQWHPHQVELTCRLISQMPSDSKDLEYLLCFLIALLPDLAAGIDFFDFLVGKKFLYFQSLCKAEDFERRRQFSNMETMMLRGERSAYGSIEQWRRDMQNVDRICQALFGRTHFFRQPAEQCIDLQNKTSRETMQNVMRILS